MHSADMVEGHEMNTRGNPVDEDYVKVNGLEIIAGNDFSRQDVFDATQEGDTKKYFHFIINESAAKALGWTPKDAVGKKLSLGDDRPGVIKAVVKDFHFASLRNPIEPLVLFPDNWGNTVMVKVSGNHIPQTIAFLQKKCREFAPNRPFEYRFMDDDFQKLYDSETRTTRVFNLFSAIAILLACIGLFGLSSYTAKQRLKEIGVRKVLGASVANIAMLLSGSFVKLVLIAFVIASPLAWLVMHKWLQDFAYRININAWMLVLSGIIAIAIALITVSFQAIRAAVANPVKNLRTE
jgi:putative ABC transport system permease protein